MKRFNPWLTARLQMVILLTVIACASPWLIAAETPLPTPRHTGDIALRGSTPRPIFNGSVVPGGVYSPAELRAAIERDAVVAAHYRDVRLDEMQAVTLTTGRAAYVSYRKGGRVHWTRERVWLKAGETVLTDGTTMIRARCGNCVSDVKHESGSAVEPAAGELDEFVVPATPDNGVDPVAATAEDQLISLLQVPFVAQMMEPLVSSPDALMSPLVVPPVFVSGGGTVGGSDDVVPLAVGATDPVPADEPTPPAPPVPPVPPPFLPAIDLPPGTGTGTVPTDRSTTTVGVDTSSGTSGDTSGATLGEPPTGSSGGATAAPEPATLWLIGAGVIGVASRRLRAK